MLIVYQDRKIKGRIQIDWTFMPWMLTTNTSLHEEVEQALNQEFSGKDLDATDASVLKTIHDWIIEFVSQNYLPGFRGVDLFMHGIEYLEQIEAIEAAVSDGVITLTYDGGQPYESTPPDYVFSAAKAEELNEYATQLADELSSRWMWENPSNGKSELLSPTPVELRIVLIAALNQDKESGDE